MDFIGLFILTLFLVYFLNAKKDKHRQKDFYISNGLFADAKKKDITQVLKTWDFDCNYWYDPSFDYLFCKKEKMRDLNF